MASLVLVVLAIWPGEVLGFWEAEGEGLGGGLRGNLQLSSVFADNPGSPAVLFPNPVDEHTFAQLRLVGDAWIGDHVAVDLNVFQSLTSTTSPLGLALGAASTVPVGRSDALRLRWNDDPQADALLEVDRLAVRITSPWVDLRLGRQPINLATTLLFTPNDVFEPFAAQAFFREFKPGVDAARADLQVGELAQVSIYGVLGYDRETLSDPDKLARPDLGASSAVARVSTPALGADVALLGGRLSDRFFVGGGVQTEFLEWLGVRAEGHVAFFDDAGGAKLELAAEVDHRFESELELRAGWFFHGAGFDDPADYLKALTGEVDPGLNFGRQYAAAAAGYPVTPLLTVNAVALANLTDLSMLGSFYLLYSISDEADLALTATVPLGDQVSEDVVDFLGQPVPVIREIRSEFGIFPRMLAVDFRVWF